MKQYKFKISSALKSLIGKDLITDDFAAIFELVKNSFDASASTVQIIFDLKTEKKEKIFIIDDGKGMSLQDIEQKWLFLAYSAKREGIEDESKKTYAGYKGVGRFSCDRLGKRLTLQTRTNSKEEVKVLTTNWADFDQDSLKEFVDIDVNYKTDSDFKLPKSAKPIEKGVVLRISGLREPKSWTRKKLIDLKRSLEKLISPFGKEKNRQKIILTCPRELEADRALKENSAPEQYIESVNGVVRNTIIEEISNRTTILEAKIDTSGNLFSKLSDRGELIYHIKENIEEAYPDLVKAHFYCRLSFLNRSAKIFFKHRMGLSSVNYGSIFLLRNNFRVYPVGEEGNDYWKIDRRKQQGHSRYLGTRDLLGHVQVFGSETHFRETSSRDKGLIRTKASEELYKCVMRCLKKLESYVVGITWVDKLDKEYSTPDRLFTDQNRANLIKLIANISHSKTIEILEINKNLVNVLEQRAKEFEPSLTDLREIANSLNDSALLSQILKAEETLKKAKREKLEADRIAQKEIESRKQAEHQAKKAKKETQKFQTAYEEEKARNLFLESSETIDKELLENFHHQIIIYAADLKAGIKNIREDLARPKPDFESIDNDLIDFADTVEQIIQTSRFATKANFRLESSKAKLDLVQFLKGYIEKIARGYNKRITIKGLYPSKAFNLEITPIQIGTLIQNLVSNAEKANSTQVEFKVEINKEILEIIVSDNGRGIDRSIVEPNRIFEKGFSRTDGSGLGLYLSKKYVNDLKGEIFLTSPQPKRGASFTLRIPKK